MSDARGSGVLLCDPMRARGAMHDAATLDESMLVSRNCD
jgi:hypothetical protein